MSETKGANWIRRWAEGDYHARSQPSALLVAWAPRLPKGRALDLACGNGRNALFLAEQGFTVEAVDIAPAALELARAAAKERGLAINLVEANLDEYPLPAQTYDLISTSFFVNREVIPILKDALKPNGFVLHEYHYITDHDVGMQKDQQFRLRRLRPNELLHLFLDFRVRFYWEGLQKDEGGGLIAMERLVAQKPPASGEPGPLTDSDSS